MAVVRTLIALLLLCGVASAQSASIKAPAAVGSGQLLILDGSESTGDAFRWIMPVDVPYIEDCDGRKIGLSLVVDRSTEYTFHLVAVSSEGPGIAVASHRVVVGGGGTQPPAPEEPEPGEPEPPANYEQLAKKSQQLAAAVDDSVTAKRLGEALQGLTGNLPANLAEAQAEAAKTIERVFLQREGVSRGKDWLGWRRLMNAEIDRLSITSVGQYREVLRAVARGLLAAVQSQAKSGGVVRMYTTASCIVCDRWKADIMPQIQAAGWQVDEVYGSRQSAYPTFEVLVNGKTRTHVGYLPISAFNQIVAELQK